MKVTFAMLPAVVMSDVMAPGMTILPPLNSTELEAEADACLTKVNSYRAGKGKAALTLKSSQNSCAASQSAKDGPNLNWHGHFGDCGEMGQCQAAGQSSCSAAIDAYYSEGPGGGHYEIIMDSRYKSMAYGKCDCSKYNVFWTHNFYTSSMEVAV